MIRVDNFSKKYKNNILFNDVNLLFETNKISFLLGRNGSGKTSLIKCLFDLENYDGDIWFDDNKIDEVRKNCFVIWDDAPFYTNLTGLQNLEILSEGLFSRSDIKECALNYLGIDILKRRVKTYSYGQRKKLAIILVELLKPRYLVMDEISNGLDYESICELKGRVKEWSENMTIILTGHQFGFYNDIVDDIYIVKENTIITRVRDFQNKKESLEELYDEELLKIRD